MATNTSIPPRRRTQDLQGRYHRTMAWVEFVVGKYRRAHGITDGGEAALDSIANSSAVIDADGGHAPADSKGLGTATALQYDRYMQRNVMRSVLRGTRPARCGRVLRASDGIRLWWDRENGSRLSNLQTCGSVWVCPVCNHKIQTARCDEVRTMLEHCKGHGWGVVFATHTVRHNRRESLLDVRHMANTIWSAVATHRVVRRMKSIVGIIGYLRATEVTWSKANGWHVHYHVYWITLQPMQGRTVEVPVYKRRKDHTAYIHHFDKLDAFDYFRDTFTRDWVDTAVKKGFAAPRFANQVFEQIDFGKESTVQAAARYCTAFKTAATPLTWKLGHELTDTQVKVGKVKRHANGKDVLHLTYWDFVRILADPTESVQRTLSDFGLTLAGIEALAVEYYRGTKGCRALVWSRGLRDMCGLGEEKTDEELAAQDCRNAEAYRLTIHHARATAKRDYVLAGLLAVCSATHGDVASCCRFLVQMRVPHEVETREHIRALMDLDKVRPSPVATLLAAEGRD